jgi:hypothetical protein
MKSRTSLFLSMLFSASAFAVEAPVEHLFVPEGFDNNDTVEVVVTGTFPNPCYARSATTATVKEDVIDIRVNATVAPESERCEALPVPFKESVTIGTLQGGTYAIHVNGKLRDKLIVKEASSNSVDDYLYASVDYIDLGFTGGASGSAILMARNNRCTRFDRVEIISNGKNTFSLLPIMKRISTECTKELIIEPIEVHFDARSLPQKSFLLFVRTMDGKSVSTVVERD